MKIVYSGVMNSINQPENGFSKAMRLSCDEYQECTYEGLAQVQSADLVFLQPQDAGITGATLQHLKNIGAFIINWSGDVRSSLPPCYIEYAKHCDLNCFSNMRDVETMRRFGFKSEFLQIGYDPEIYYPDPNIEKDIDIVFMGNNFGHFPLSSLRKEMVSELKRTYGERFKAYGIGQPDGNFMGDQKGEADIYRRSKIGINLSHFDLPRYTSDRMFRMLGSGICVLTNWFSDYDKDFMSLRDIEIWDDLKELKEGINWLLSGEKIRISIAENGHRLALNNHTFSHMVRNIIELWQKSSQQ